MTLTTDMIGLTLAFVALLIVFWFVQLRTRFLSTRYYLQEGLLLFISVFAIYLGLKVAAESPGPVSVVALALFLVAAVYHLILFTIKLTAESDTKYRWIYRANRALVNYDCPHDRFTVKTDDGITLQAIGLKNDTQTHEKAIIVCHGAGRSKNTLPVVQTCRILATKYDVYTFDFRGHMESYGVFQADGDTEYDLKAMIDHLDQAGYQKIAVFGWSIGAWTALLSASRGRHINAIIAGSPPPVHLARLVVTQTLAQWRLLQIPVLAGVAVVRNMWVKTVKSALNIEDFVRHIPEMPILLVYNDYDYTIKASADAFEDLYEKLPPTKEKLRFPGRGHLFDWPNTYFLWVKMLDWLEHNF